MPRIIRRGIHPDQVVRHGTCPSCFTIAEYIYGEDREGVALTDQTTVWRVSCPVCAQYLDWDDLTEPAELRDIEGLAANRKGAARGIALIANLMDTYVLEDHDQGERRFAKACRGLADWLSNTDEAITTDRAVLYAKKRFAESTP